MASMKVRLKKACKGREMMISKDGKWLTEGHFAIHRGMLIEQGLELPEDTNNDGAVYKALGLNLIDRAPDVDKILDSLKGHATVELLATEFRVVNELTLTILSSEDLTAFVQTMYIDLVPVGTTFATYISRGDKGEAKNSIFSKVKRFIVMPVRNPKGARESFTQFAQNLLEMKERKTK